MESKELMVLLAFVAIALVNISAGREIPVVLDFDVDSAENRDNDDPAVVVRISVSTKSKGSVGYLNQRDGESDKDKKLQLVNKVIKSSRNSKDIDFDYYKTTTTTLPPPPFYNQTAKMARYIVKYSDWCSMATVSSRIKTISPFSNVVSVSDGPLDKSTGVPYMYVTDLDLSSKDLKANPRLSLSMTLAQSSYCQSQALDPEDPRCARVILSGNFVRVANGTDEASFAAKAMFSRHPVMESWPADHGFFFGKLDIKKIYVLDFFGGAVTVPLKDYYKAKP